GRTCHRPGRLHGLIIRHNLDRRNDRIAGSAGDVVPGIRVQLIPLQLVLDHGLIALAGFAIDLFPRHTPLSRSISHCKPRPRGAKLIWRKKREDGQSPAPLPDPPLTPEQLRSLRQQLSRMSMTAVHDAYHAAWTKCKMDGDGTLPKARFIQ